MKLNKKGMTLIELLISIILVGLVLTFLLQLLNDLESETENNNYAYNNQVNRADIIYTVEKDLQKYNLTGVEWSLKEGNIIIKFNYIKEGGTAVAILESEKSSYIDEEFGDDKTKYYLKYTSYSGEKYSWEMKGATIDTCGSFKYHIDNNSNSYYFILTIPVYNSVYNERNNKDKNNAVDDIEISYAGIKSDLDISKSAKSGSYLTTKYSANEKIGPCVH